MKNDKKKILFFLYLLNFFLIIFTLIIFFKPKNLMRTQILSSQKSIFYIEINDAKNLSKLELEKKDDFWIGHDTEFGYNFPVDLQKIENFFLCAKREFPVKKKSKKKSSWENFDLDNGNFICVNFYEEEKKLCDCVFFGKKDFLNEEIFFRKANEKNIFSISDEIAPFVTTDANFWCDPFIAPQCVTKLNRKDSEKFLRRGKLTFFNSSAFKDLQEIVTLNFKNQTCAKFSFFKNENIFIVIPNFFYKGEFPNKKIIENFFYSFSVSEQTFKNFLEKFYE